MIVFQQIHVTHQLILLASFTALVYTTIVDMRHICLFMIDNSLGRGHIMYFNKMSFPLFHPVFHPTEHVVWQGNLLHIHLHHQSDLIEIYILHIRLYSCPLIPRITLKI